MPASDAGAQCCATRSLNAPVPHRHRSLARRSAYVRQHLPGHAFEVGNSMDMRFGENPFDVVASALVLHFIPDRAKALRRDPSRVAPRRSSAATPGSARGVNFAPTRVWSA